MSWKSNYKSVRNASWIWYLLAFVFFIFAVQAFPTPRNPNGSMNLFIFWIALTTGLMFSAGRTKRKAKRDQEAARALAAKRDAEQYAREQAEESSNRKQAAAIAAAVSEALAKRDAESARKTD
ncbi:hypothetical protein [Pseudomonas sp.]|uniref:hypothetical protein n=1 Tax=Pseudomonas sp. TaxID=306 RepID=UPI0028ACE4CF|nr:hypothetical protein [Pseudomonas sp.]